MSNIPFLNTLQEYEERGLLRSQTHPTYPLTIWNYTEDVQWSGEWDEVTIMCRGLVTDNEGNIVARPFKKFWNMEENRHRRTANFEVYTKMDGSLILLFWYDGVWITATRGSFTSDQAIAAHKVFMNELDNNFSIGITYLFEYIAPWNRVVVNYGDVEKLVLLGAIRTDDGTEATYEQLMEIGKGASCEVVKSHNGITSYVDLKKLNIPNEEGFVVKFTNGDRCKIKFEDYIQLHRVVTNFSTKSVWEALKNGIDILDTIKDIPDEFYGEVHKYHEELVDRFQTIEEEAILKFREIKIKMDEMVLPSSPKAVQKEFAFLAKEYRYPSIIFKMNEGKPYSEIIWKILKPKYEKL